MFIKAFNSYDGVLRFFGLPWYYIVFINIGGCCNLTIGWTKSGLYKYLSVKGTCQGEKEREASKGFSNLLEKVKKVSK